MREVSVRYRTREGDTADLIAWRVYGRQDDGVVEALIDANPGLADYGPVLPEGLAVELPEISTAPVTASVRLWS
jgi:phage tail protein X